MRLASIAAFLAAMGVAAWPVPAADPTSAPTVVMAAQNKGIGADQAKSAQEQINKGIVFLTKSRNEDGGWGFKPGQSHPAITAMALKVLLGRPDFPADNDVVKAGLDRLLKFRQDDGGIYLPKEGNDNYTTCVAVMALAAAKDPKYKDALDGAVKFLRGQQIKVGSKTPDGQEVAKDHPFEGGVSYGRQGRPDLSNEGYWMQAMHEAGVSGDDPDMQRALAFVKRVQNRTEGSEGQSFVVKGEDDGGFIYAINKKDGQFVGESFADESDRGLRSYGSMTYTGFKSMLYANVAKDDPRVKAAYEWIRKFWRLDSNPNVPQDRSRQGLYYYYDVFAKALRAWGQDEIPDTKDVKHNWRNELVEVLAKQQKADGSWANEQDRWMEASPVLVTCYAIGALQETLAK
jgi:squalene-hopene/tetraprenyl-beta-curcumene cyclase